MYFLLLQKHANFNLIKANNANLLLDNNIPWTLYGTL